MRTSPPAAASASVMSRSARSVRQSLPPLASGDPVGVGDPSERNPFLEFRDETFIALHGLGRKGAGAYAVNSDSAHCPMAGRITCELDQSRLCCTVGGRVVEVRMATTLCEECSPELAATCVRRPRGRRRSVRAEPVSRVPRRNFYRTARPRSERSRGLRS